jgi:hypothetical protein
MLLQSIKEYILRSDEFAFLDIESGINFYTNFKSDKKIRQESRVSGKRKLFLDYIHFMSAIKLSHFGFHSVGAKHIVCSYVSYIYVLSLCMFMYNIS